MLSFNCILDLAWHRWMKLILELKYMFLSYTANRMPADALETLVNHCISKHVIGPQSRNISLSASKELLLNVSVNSFWLLEDRNHCY